MPHPSKPLTIVYVAKHDSGGNDDEGAITQALTDLGHRVERVREIRGGLAHRVEGDFMLMHCWSEYQHLARFKIPKVFWYFDLVDFPDPSLAPRCNHRKAWISGVTQAANLGFCTDGDWVAKDTSGKLIKLTQGADARRVVDEVGTSRARPSILFTGIQRGGQTRQSFVDEMRARYGSSFQHVQKGTHGSLLAQTINQSRIVVAPDGPVTHNYWSNRVYLTLGFGGFLLHPYCRELAKDYQDQKEIVYYSSREELHRLIEFYSSQPAERQRIAEAGLARTKAEHTYTHRVAKLIEIVRARCLNQS